MALIRDEMAQTRMALPEAGNYLHQIGYTQLIRIDWNRGAPSPARPRARGEKRTLLSDDRGVRHPLPLREVPHDPLDHASAPVPDPSAPAATRAGARPRPPGRPPHGHDCA